MSNTYKYEEDFFGGLSIDTTANNSGWVADLVGTATVTGVDGASLGEVSLACDSTSGAQRAVLHYGDTLCFDIDNIKSVEMYAKVSGIDSVSTVAFGISSDHNSDDDAIAQAAWFKLEGSASTSNVVVETDDGTLNNDDVASGETLGSTHKRCVIDFSQGKSDVRFYIDNGNGQLRRVASGTTFDMSNYAGSFQPYFRCEKASGTGIPALNVDYVGIEYKR